jgi:uncharacterized protein DUF6883
MLPNGDRAILDLRKLVDYCLNPAHSRGRHKARVFRDSLGMGQADATELRALLLYAAAHETAIRFRATPGAIDGRSTFQSRDRAGAPW